MTGRLLAVSPHLDDAVFSAGGTLARRVREGWTVGVATAFTASVAAPAGFALACQLDKGLGPDVDYMALRRAEDVAACAAIGATPIHLPFVEAPHRGYDSAAALFGALLPGDDIGAPLAAALAALVADWSPTLILGPAGIGGHVDHLIVRTALGGLAVETRLWADWPYADRAAPMPGEAVDLEPADIAAKAAAAACYTTQLGFQFGSPAAMIARVERITSERFQPI